MTIAGVGITTKRTLCCEYNHETPGFVLNELENVVKTYTD
jgi:hypothetical protein